MSKRVRTLFKTKRRPLKLRAWRTFRGDISQEDLAEESGVSQGLISQLEGNKTDYSGDTLAALAHALKCDETDLFRDPNDPEGLGKTWDELTPVERRQAVAVIRGLKRASGQ